MVGLLVRLPLSLHFDGLYGQDSFAYFNYGIDVQQAVQQLTPPDAMYWPMGFPILLAGVFTVVGESAEAAQLLVMVCGALTGSLTFLLVADGVYPTLSLPIPMGRESKGGELHRQIIPALSSALLVTFSGQILQSSVVIMADVPALMLAILSAWCLVRYAKDHPLRWLLFSSGTLAFAGITRWTYLLLVLPYGVFFVYFTSPPNPLSVKQRGGARLAHPRLRGGVAEGLRHGFYAGVVGLLILVPQLAHSQRNPAALEGHSWLKNWSLSHADEKNFVTSDGTFHYEHPIAYYYARAAWDGYFIHPIFLPFILLGLLHLIRQQNFPLLILVGGWLLVEYGFLIGIPYQNIRFSLAFFVPLAVLAGVGLAQITLVLWGLMDSIDAVPTAFSVGTRYIVSAITILISIYTTTTAAQTEIDRFIGLKNADVDALEWTQAMIPEPAATVYTLDLWLMMQHYTPELHAQQIYYETPQTLANKNLDSTYWLLNLWTIENQWVGKAPYIAYHWLDEHYRLKRIGRHGYYTLLQVEDDEH